jgi:hypothetical protein
MINLLPCLPSLPFGLQIPNRYSSQPSACISPMDTFLYVFNASLRRSFSLFRSSSSSPSLTFLFTPTASAIFSSRLSIASKRLSIFESIASMFLPNVLSSWWTRTSSCLSTSCSSAHQLRERRGGGEERAGRAGRGTRRGRGREEESA